MKTFIKHFSPTRRIIAFFVGVILIGSLLLSLPFVQLASSKASYLDHLFTTVSMVCVTGLSTQPVAETYNMFGQFICILLMQIGGLGVLSFLGLLYFQTSKKFSYIDRTTLQENLNRDNPAEFKQFMFSIFRFTFTLEAIGALLLSLRFIPLFGWGKGSFSAIFLAVSAFCNAGFDNLGTNSLQDYQTDPLINLVIACLIIMGGIGFSVWFDLRTQVRQKFRFKRLHFHTKTVLWLTVLILTSGTLLTLLTEFNNPQTIGRLGFFDKVLVSFFQTVTMRTAGFATIDYTKAHPVTLFFYLIQMFLGGAPGGTAGGLKITTMLVIFLFVRGQVLGLPHTNFRYHTIGPNVSQKAFAIFAVFSAVFLLGLAFLVYLEPKTDFLYLVFEAMSALATVGVTANLTSQLTVAGLWVVMGLMFAGRIGPITILTGLSKTKPSKKQTLKYTKSNLLIG